MSERDLLREKWRLAAIAATQAADKAARAKEGRDIFFDQLVEGLLAQAGERGEKLSNSAAERQVRVSGAYRQYLRKMHDLKLAADLLKVEAQNADRVYYDSVSADATYRAEMRMTGVAA